MDHGDRKTRKGKDPGMVATRSPTLKPVTPSDRLDYPRADASNIQIISPLDDLALLRPRPNSRVTRGHLGYEGSCGNGTENSIQTGNWAERRSL